MNKKDEAVTQNRLHELFDYKDGNLYEQPQGVKFNEGLWQEREARIAQLEAELMRMQGRELKLQFALAEQPAPVAPPHEQQEPVGYFRLREYGSALIHDQVSEDAKHNKGVFPLYTSPPASKPWVGLTEQECEKLRWQALEEDAGYTQLIKATEAKLREKNA